MNDDSAKTICSGEGCVNTITTPDNAALSFTFTCKDCCGKSVSERSEKETQKIAGLMSHAEPEFVQVT